MAKSKNKPTASRPAGSASASTSNPTAPAAGNSAGSIAPLVGNPALLGISMLLFGAWFVFLTIVAIWG